MGLAISSHLRRKAILTLALEVYRFVWIQSSVSDICVETEE